MKMLLDARRETQALRELVRTMLAFGDDDDDDDADDEGVREDACESNASARDSYSSQSLRVASGLETFLAMTGDLFPLVEAAACVAPQISSGLAATLLYVRSALDCLMKHCRSESCPLEAGSIRRDV